MTTVLFVCTGNTCRSPMAQCMFNAIAKERGRTDLRAISAGLYAANGEPASLGAQHAMAARGLSLSSHQSQPLSERLVHDVSIIVGLTDRHILGLQARYPMLRIQSFSPSISDPYGMDDQCYQHAANEIEHQLRQLIDEL
ncbi:MAG: hypothetical protein GX096_00175 [Clostridiales bacterium]|nr:hypothetical protein [Clostridiales bacterium]